jgi:hypothetical protein
MGRGPTLVEARAADPVRSPRRRPRRRRILVPLLAVLALLVALVALALFPAAGAAEDLRAGRDALTEARDLLVAGDATGAADAFGRAGDRFEAAADAAGSPFVRLAGAVPLAGRSLDAIGALAEVGRRSASAGRALSQAVAEVPGGLGSLAPRDGRIPVEPMAALLLAVAAARADLEAAREAAAALPRSYVPARLVTLGDRAREEVESGHVNNIT